MLTEYQSLAGPSLIPYTCSLNLCLHLGVHDSDHFTREDNKFNGP